MTSTGAPLETGTWVRCRLARVEGQVAGLRRRWHAQRPAEELLDQLGAVRAALRGVAIVIVHDTAEARLSVAPARPEDAERLDDVLALVDRLLSCR